MKIQCDVCGKEEASVFCCADEAALCAACDRRVHRANKLAGKHRRFSLLSPSSSPSQSHPLCDVCQERRGFLFCQEDRAILCRDCDAPIHTANDLTMKHNRFLLTGVRLSSAPIPSSSPSSPPPNESDKAPAPQDNISGESNSSGSSSISEYLIKMLPGYRVEDLLVDDAMTDDGLYKRGELLPFLEADQGGGRLGAAGEKFPIWVPHVPHIPPSNLSSTVAAAVFAGGAVLNGHQCFGAKEASHSHQHHGVKAVTTQWSEDSFMVPQISPASSNSKRPRPSPSLWYF